MEVSISELKSNLFYYLHCAEQGKVIWVMAHQQRVAQLVTVSKLETQVTAYLLPNTVWNGKKPKLPLPIKLVQGGSCAETVLEMR